MVYGAILREIDGVPGPKNHLPDEGKRNAKMQVSSVLIIKKQRAPLEMPTRLTAARDSGFSRCRRFFCDFHRRKNCVIIIPTTENERKSKSPAKCGKHLRDQQRRNRTAPLLFTVTLYRIRQQLSR